VWNKRQTVSMILSIVIIAIFSAGCSDKVNQEAVSWNEKGNEYHSYGLDEEAIGAYEKATEIDPGYADAWYNLGEVHVEHSDYEEALLAFDNVAELEPKNASAWYYKSIILFNKREAIPSIGEQEVQSKYTGVSEEIIQDIDKAIELDPENTAFLDAKGSLLRGMGESEEAIEVYDKIIELNPQDAEAWENKGNLLSSLGRYDEALQAFDKVIELDPQNSDVWDRKSTALKHLGRDAEAQECSDKFHEM